MPDLPGNNFIEPDVHASKQNNVTSGDSPNELKNTIGKNRHLIIGAGQIGSSLEAALASLKYPVRTLRRKDFDLNRPRELEKVFAGEEFDYVWLTAAETRVDWCEDNPEYSMKVNAESPGEVAIICGANGARLFHFSTDYVFSGFDNGQIRSRPYLETDEPSPLSVYGRSKLEGERRALEGSANVTIIRTSGVFSSSRHNFFRAVLSKANEGIPFEVVSDQVTSPTYAPHLAIWLAARQADLPTGILHLAAAGGCNWFEAARAALELAGQNPNLVRESTSDKIGRRAKRPPYSLLGSGVLPFCGLPGLPGWLEGLSAWAAEIEGQKLE